MELFMKYITEPNKKVEVDEAAENIDILYNKELFEIEEFTDHIREITKFKVKDYPSLTKKAIFKFMDLLER